MKTFSKVMALVICAAVMVGAGILTSCSPNYGTPTTRSYNLGEYTAIDASSAWDIEMIEGISEATVTLDEVLFDHLVFEVKEVEGIKTLFIDLTGWQTGRIKSMKVSLPLNEELRNISMSGACDITIIGNTALEKVELSGASKADITGAGNMKKVFLSGASKAKIAGQGDEMTISISGASKLDAEKLYLSSVQGMLSGASNIDVTICSSLEVVASGASHITYGLVSPTCDPEINCDLTGGSTITER